MATMYRAECQSIEGSPVGFSGETAAVFYSFYYAYSYAYQAMLEVWPSDE